MNTQIKRDYFDGMDPRAKRLSAALIFDGTGFLLEVLLNTPSDLDQVTLERALSRLIKTGSWCRLKKLFKR